MKMSPVLRPRVYNSFVPSRGEIGVLVGPCVKVREHVHRMLLSWSWAVTVKVIGRTRRGGGGRAHREVRGCRYRRRDRTFRRSPYTRACKSCAVSIRPDRYGVRNLEFQAGTRRAV